MKFKITYSEGDTINKTCEIEADSKSQAMVAFWIEHYEANDVSKVEKVPEEEDD